MTFGLPVLDGMRPDSAGMDLLDDQFRRPAGVFGRVVGAMMARTTMPLVVTAAELVAPVAGERVLDVGFGPGTSFLRLAAIEPAAVLYGLDASPVMVRAARRRTSRLAMRPDLRYGDVCALPWPDDSFDVVCSTNSVQFWDPLPRALREVRRVLRRDGRLVLSVHEQAVHPAGGEIGRDFDGVLMPAVEAAGFSVLDAGYRATVDGQALICRATYG